MMRDWQVSSGSVQDQRGQKLRAAALGRRVSTVGRERLIRIPIAGRHYA